MEVKPGYKQTEVGVIPEDWAVSTIGDSYQIFNNLRFPISHKDRKSISGPYPYYGPTGIQDYINEYRVEGEFSLIGEDGDHFLKWQTQPMTLLVNGKFNVNNHAHIVKGVKNTTKWFYFFFMHRDISTYLTKQGAGRLKLTKQSLSKIPVILPPLPEQTAIATALSDVDALISALDRLIEKKRAIKQAAMQELLTGKRRLPGFDSGKGYKQTEVGVIPEDWAEDQLGHYVNIFSGESPSNFNFVDSGTPFFKVEQFNVGFKYLIETPYYFIGDKKISKGSVVFPKRGASILLNRVRILFYDSYIDPNLMALTTNESINNDFLYYLLSFIQLAKLADTTSIPQINNKHISPLVIPIPPLPEQTAIATVLSDMDAEIAALESRRAKTISLKQGMMQELLTGRIRLV